MNQRVRVYVTLFALVLLVIGLYFFTDWFSKTTGYFIGEDEKTKLAQCLSNNGAQFFSADYCSECERQTNLLGEAFKEIETINCGRLDNPDEKCKNLRSIPAWYINKSFEYGFQNFNELKEKSGCV